MSEIKDIDDLIVKVIESAHEDTLSDDPQKAIVARARKAILESTLRWLDSEEKRGSDFGDVVHGFTYFAGGVAAKIAVSCRDSGDDIPANEKITETFTTALRDESLVAMSIIIANN